MKIPLILTYFVVALFTQTYGLNEKQSIQDLLQQKNEDTDYQRLCRDTNITLSFSGLQLNSINGNFLTSPIIKCLDLSQNSINRISGNAFSNLPNLKYLNLEHNQFDLQDIFLNNLSNIETLILNDNPNVGYNYVINLEIKYPKLKKLFVKNANRRYFFSNLENVFPVLTHLYLSGSRIEQDKFEWLPKTLEYLDLSGHHLNTLTLKGLVKLEMLLLNEPYEKRLHQINFENLINLKYLSVPSNQLSQITSNTFVNISTLLYLDLSDNNIEYIEGGSLDSMKNLQFLNLSYNQIDVISGGTFDKLRDLKVLALEKNKISMFPMIANEMKLEKLYLNCNQLKGIIGGTFTKMKYLETLFLHGNELSYIDEEAFQALHNLKTLTLSYNKLSSLPQSWMRSMLNLRELDLTGNYFFNLGDISLSDNSPLKNLYLSNQLKVIHSTSVFTIPENSTISLDPSVIFVKKCCNDEERQYGKCS